MTAPVCPYGLTARGTSPAFFNMPGDFTGVLPAVLSQTGVFTNTPDMNPAPGLIPYAKRTRRLWSDNAVKSRWLAVPCPWRPDHPSGSADYLCPHRPMVIPRRHRLRENIFPRDRRNQPQRAAAPAGNALAGARHQRRRLWCHVQNGGRTTAMPTCSPAA